MDWKTIAKTLFDQYQHYLEDPTVITAVDYFILNVTNTIRIKFNYQSLACEPSGTVENGLIVIFEDAGIVGISGVLIVKRGLIANVPMLR